MGVMAVTGIVQIDDLRLGMFQDEFDILDDGTVPLFFDFFTWITELGHEAVFTDIGGFALFDQAHLLHLVISVFFIRPFARAAGAVRDDDTAEPFVLGFKALGDAMVGGDFQIVLMRNNAQMRDAAQGGKGFRLIGDENVVFGMAEFHFKALSAWEACTQEIRQDRGPTFYATHLAERG